ncbi:zinc finger protein [Turdus rufiventris]|nr:zinc finger protein [Turdus rufiventris]
MTGETQHVYTIGDTEAGPKEPDKDFGCEGCGDKDGRALGGEGTPPFPKDKEPHSQREAVIRPQQAGKIDFKSLQCKPKFGNDSAWGEVKGSALSPPGKGRARERSRRSGKGERGHQQLYRLSIAGTRPSPTIGIAYPQQKVAPPKKPEVAPAASSYRFHVPSIAQRDAELRPQELGFGRCFPDAAGGRTSSFTSQPGAPLGPKGQPPAASIPLKSPGTHGQLHYLEFQANRAESWPSPEKSFAGATYGISVQKASSFSEGGKAAVHGLGALPCQLPFQLLHEAGKEPFRSGAGSQEFLDVGIATSAPLAPAAFSFHSSPREWPEEPLGSYESVSPEGRLYGLPVPPPPAAPFLHPPPPPALHHGPLAGFKGRAEHPADPTGALPSSGAIDQNPSTFQENQAVFPSSLHSPTVPKPAGNRQASAKDGVPSARLLVPSSPLRRTVPPNSLSQVHFQSKAYCSSPGGVGAVPFETSVPTTAPTHPRLVQAWEGATKAFSPMDQNSAPYSNPVGNQFSFECQSGPEQRQHRQKNARLPWQQMHLPSAMPGANRLELSRHISSQKLPFPPGTSDWQGSGKAQKGPPISNSPGYHSKKLLSGESLQRGDPSVTGAFSFDSGKEPGSPACDSRSKALFYSMAQAAPPPPPPSRSSSGSGLVLPPSALVAASPCESPLPSPVPNPTCGSTCSSLSPMSSSPLNPGFEDSQVTPSPFFQHPCHAKDANKGFHPSEVLSPSSLHYHAPDSAKSFSFPPDALKDDSLLKCAPASPFHKPAGEVAKGCSDGLDGEQPPPPYSSHHLLATSLSSASLDQLDVLLTCRQCDQNYSNLSSFLQHRQFCASHPAAQGEPRDVPRSAEGRKVIPPEPSKPLELSADPQGHLLALNKSDDFLLDGESKGEGKEDALKGGLFHGLASSSLPLSASDLDIDDAKLDSLITEALNGLGYQSDNPEIDSSFIDVFADEELPGVRAAAGAMAHKASDSKSKQAAEEKAAGEAKAGCLCEDGEQVKRGPGKQHLHKGRVARRVAPQDTEGTERTARLRAGRKNSIPPATTPSQKHPRKLSQEPAVKSEVGPGSAAKSSKPPRFSMKDVKKRKPRSGTWSKELIHKIVQQKNKLHKLQVKSSKQAQLPQATERPLAATKEGGLREYDYVSDSDEEGAECSKPRGRRKRGTGFMGRRKYSFSKKRLGRSERAREKDPAWSYSQKREAQEDGDVPSQEDAEKEDCAARARRRSSHSSAGSNHNVPKEMGTSPACAGEAGDKGGSQRRRHSGSPARVPRTPLSPPQDSSPKMSQESKEDIPRGSRRLGSAKALPAGSRTRPRTEPDVAAMDCAKEEPSPQPQERQMPGTATPGRSPASFSSKDGVEEPRGAAKLPDEAGEPTQQAQGSPELTVHHQRHQFAPFPSEGLKYHTEEAIAPAHSGNKSSPGRGSAACSEAGAKYTKGQGLCDSQKDFPAPAPTYGGDAVGMMLTAKAPDPYVSSDNAFFDPKGLPGHYDDHNLFPKPPALGSSHMDDMYLCRDDIGASSFEQKHSSISPFATEMPQGKVSSPLSFDSSSIFAELPVSEFDPYESKDGYVTAFPCPPSASRKPLPFEPPYPPFLPEKDWSLMEEVAPMLPEDMTQFHSLSVEKPPAKKFPEEGAVPSSQLSLPDRIADYGVAFISNISDDELEIKRLVTELESQLQSSKLDSEVAITLQKAEPNVAVHLRAQGAEHFQEAGQEKALFLAGELGRSGLCAGDRLAGDKPDMVTTREDYERAREPWLELGSLETGMCVPAGPLATNHFCSKDGSEQLQGTSATEERDLRKMENGSSSKSLPGSSTTEQTEAPIYTDPVTKSPPVVTESVFPKTVDAAEGTKDPLASLPHQGGAEGFPVPGKADTDPARLEEFDAHLPNPKPQFCFQQGPAPALDLTFSPHIKEVPDTEEKPLSRNEPPKRVKSAVDLQGGPVLLEERKSPNSYESPGLGDKASKPKALLLEMLSVPKESAHPSQEMTVASQETSANPLQQLQLFVARTVKNNEEELLMPCFPGLLAPGHPSAANHVQVELKDALEGEDQTQGEGDTPVGSSTGNISAPGKEGLSARGCEQPEPLDAEGSYPAKQSTAKPELQNNVTELQHLANESLEPRDINIPADGVSQERNDLSPPSSTALTSLPGQAGKADQLREEQEGDNDTTTLAFRKHEQSHPSRGLLEEETLGREEGERLGRSGMGKGAQHPGSAPTSPVSPLGPSEGDLHQDHSLGMEMKSSTVSESVPREGNGKLSLNGCHYTGESPASLLLPAKYSDLKCLQSSGAERGEVPSFGTQHSETRDYPSQPTADPLPMEEREISLSQENKLENCSPVRIKHQSEPETLSNGFAVQDMSAAISRGLTRVGDLDPAELNGHEFSGEAEVRLGVSKTTESEVKSLKGEECKSHGTAEAGGCVLNSVGQGQDCTPSSTADPPRNELHKAKKPGGLPVTCDICSATFRSKPGLTRHKAVKHQVKNGGLPQPSKTPRSPLVPAHETAKAAQKVPRRSLKASVKDKTCSSQVPTSTLEHIPKKTLPDLEKEPSSQMQEVVSRVLSDLSGISLEMSQELHRTRVLQREGRAKGPRPEMRGSGEAASGKLDSVRKGEKGRRSQSKGLGEENSSSEKQLSRKVRRRKAKVFPRRNEPCELEKSTGPAALSSSLPGITEDLHEPDGCISTEQQNRTSTAQHSQKAKESSCAEDLDSRMGSLKEMVSKETATGSVTCAGQVEDPDAVEDTQACKKWIGGFVKQVEKGWGKVGTEQQRGAGGTEDMNAGTGDSPAAGSDPRNWSSALQGPTAPAEGALLLENHDLGTTQNVSGHTALQTPLGSSPPPAEPQQWVKADVPPGREHCGDSTAASELQSFFDDDSTFSQLFPGDEQCVRRKCTRVYGKRSKKPKPVPELSLQPAGAVDLFTIRLASDLSDSSSFCVTREEPCEYETISVDDALMLNMCHGSKAKSGEAAPKGSESIELRLDQEVTDQEKEDIDLEDNMLTFLCQNSHADSVPSLNIWGSLEKEGDSLSAEDMFEPLMDLEDEHSLQEVNSEPPDLAEDSYNAKDNGDSDSPEFHTIDIEMLNAKLKMRDVCFFSPCEDLPGCGEDSAGNLKPKSGKHRSKLEDGKLGKNRGEITIKTKDKQYKCKVCFQWFLTLGELDFHKLSHNPSPPPTCYMCVQRKFSSREQLRDHLKEKHARNKAGLWACGMCLKEISDVWMYNEHLREHATQFARKGQAQKSVMGLPGCFGEDNAAVTHFLNTIMYHKPSRSSRHGVSRESKSPKEVPPEQEKVMKDPAESSVKVKPPAPSSSKASSSPSPEHTARSENAPKSVPMHPDCKDPSRDCHHCGKQFPKPFKLQRHLVVHSLQKIYLCHKCPMFYQETKELRSHLSQEHGVVEEQEIKHTTLYACELCADVMHVIKKSFICSMCNYTFSKKEQYDRHMEKHLAGSSKTFKFRGVMRPGATCREGREKVKEDGSLREGMPPSKKRKVAHHGSSIPRSSPVHLDPASDLQLVETGSPNLQVPTDSFPTAPGDLGEPQPSVKVLVGDFSELLAEMEKSPFDPLPPPPCLSPSLPPAAVGSPELGPIAGLSMEELEKGEFDGKPLPFLDSPEFPMDLAGLACHQATNQKLSPPLLTHKHGCADAHKKTSTGNKDEYRGCILENASAETNAMDEIPFLQLAKKVSELPSPKAESPQATETHKWGDPSASDASAWEGAAKPASPEGAPQPPKDRRASPTPNRAPKDSAPPKKSVGGEVAPGAGSTEEGQPISGKEKSVPEAKDSSTNSKDQGRSSGHQPRAEVSSNTTRHGHAEPGRAASKLHPKRRKEHKSSSHRSSSGSRENMEGDGKKKKARPPCPVRSESAAELKRGSWSSAEAPALSPGRRDTHCSKLAPKPRAGPQLKKMVLDPYNQKKGEIRHANGDVKRRKAILGKSLHQVLAKGPAPAPRGSWHGPRGAKAAGPASYRSAESQNNLLSQLFGQKLTSFKIPLRRDTSE